MWMKEQCVMGGRKPYHISAIHQLTRVPRAPTPVVAGLFQAPDDRARVEPRRVSRHRVHSAAGFISAAAKSWAAMVQAYAL
jgi:hypothetical protein